VDYNNVNALWTGTEGKQGSYMFHFAELIKKIHQQQPDHDIFFLAENVVPDNGRNVPHKEENLKEVKENLEQVKDTFGTVWSIVLDATYFSPVRRKRIFFSNIPLGGDYIEATSSETSLVKCLQDGYQHAADNEMQNPSVKANCFMATKSRVDDDRMIVVKTAETKKRTLNTQEREAMMGYPECYVEKPGMSFVCVN
jgi:site-specific DNA-cytosine methylase